jgi:hypothetical protein
MEKLISIGDINIALRYQYSDYFKDCLDAYENDFNLEESHILEIITKKELKEEVKKNAYHYKNRVKYYDDLETSIVTRFPDGSIKHIISYDNDFKHVRIELNECIKERLAEYEYVLSGMLFFEIALRNGYLPMHASAIKFNNQAILLSGPSKSGKSTQTEYFLKVNKEALIINEDKPLIKKDNGQVFVWGSPWSGKHVLNQNVKVPLKAIFFLNKSDKTLIKPLKETEKIKNLMRNIHRPGDEVNIDNMIDVVNEIVSDCSIYEFDCENNENSALELKRFLEDEL